jgi:NAD(P)-dependent dehydrogenase (short-subunit alcohol dehydrogenase family)
MRIDGSVFVVTGGGSGLGAATVRLFSRRGAKVAVADLNEETGTKVAAECGPGVRFFRTDVTDESSVEGAIRAALESFGRLNGAVNCAGIAPAERVVGKAGPHSLALFSKVVQVNLIGTFNVTRLAAAAISRMEPGPEGERGVIINTASVAAYEGQIGQVAYSASKGGIVSMTLPIARELARFGIRVMTIAPGIFATPLMDGLPEAVQQSLGQQVPFPSRLGRPEEYAELALHIVENPMLNGEVIRLDGAMRLAAK